VGGMVHGMIEEKCLSEEAAGAAHAAFNRTLESQINKILPTLRQGTPLPPAKIEQLKDEVAHRFRDAVIGSELAGFFRAFNLFNPDDPMWAVVFFTAKSSDIYARFL